MARRKTPRLAYSEYVSPDTDNSTQIWRARMEVIEATARVHPKFLKRLSDDVFPRYQQAADGGYNFDRILWVQTGLSPIDLLPPDSSLKSALPDWAAEFNAESATWLIDGAFRTLRFWYVAPEKRNSLSWFKMHPFSTAASIGDAFTFGCEGWETELLTWAAYSQSVRRRFEQKLAEYEKQTRALAESCGLIRARQKYSVDNFDWFVLYQFAGLSSVEIVRGSQTVNSVDESTVLKGIKAAAKLIGWQRLRPPHETQKRKIR